VTPVSVCLRPDFETLLRGVRSDVAITVPKAGAGAEIHETLRQRGALFFDEIVNATRRLRSDVERGLRELIAWGLVASDGFQGLRQLSGRVAHTGRPRSSARESAYTAQGFFTGSGPAGRWALLPELLSPVPSPTLGRGSPVDGDDHAEALARILLQRYGVVFRDLYPRESFTLPWRDILRALRRLEARGLVRGGRFVSGFNGEQYALPEAVDSLRWVRRQERNGERVWVAAVDPVNLIGVVIPGDRVAAQSGRGIMFVDGLPEAAPATAVSEMKTPVPSKLTPRLREPVRR
jgi:ATP-dependent Lhr-like helicase